MIYTSFEFQGILYHYQTIKVTEIRDVLIDG